jgi:hypothetical protein
MKEERQNNMSVSFGKYNTDNPDRKAGYLFSHVLRYIVHKKIIGSQEIWMNVFKKSMVLTSYIQNSTEIG